MTEYEEFVNPPPGVPVIVHAPCGNAARWDYKSGYGYRCMSCFAVLGSIGMPKQCSELYNETKTCLPK
jgi:hypothetical protein